MASAELSDLAFVNDALANLGEDPLTDLLPESGSTNAIAARIYPRRVEALLSERDWNFATRIVELSALSEDPPTPWTVQYALPVGTLRVVSTDIPRECYALASDNTEDGTRRLYATRSAVRLVVVVRPLEASWPAYFVNALIPDLSWHLAAGVTGKTDFATYFKGEAKDELSRAKVADAGESPPKIMAARDPRAGGSANSSGFYIPGGWNLR